MARLASVKPWLLQWKLADRGVQQYSVWMLDFSELCAANEDDYRYQRHRTSPISSTIYSIPNYPKKLRIYLTNSSPYWQVCCFFKGKTYRRSLKTTIRQVAIRAAKDFFHQSVADLYGTTINIREDKVLLWTSHGAVDSCVGSPHKHQFSWTSSNWYWVHTH